MRCVEWSPCGRYLAAGSFDAKSGVPDKLPAPLHQGPCLGDLAQPLVAPQVLDLGLAPCPSPQALVDVAVYLRKPWGSPLYPVSPPRSCVLSRHPMGVGQGPQLAWSPSLSQPTGEVEGPLLAAEGPLEVCTAAHPPPRPSSCASSSLRGRSSWAPLQRSCID